MTDEQLKHILESARIIATVGLSDNPDKPSHDVARYLIRNGYRVIPVNPFVTAVFGEKAYPDLLSIPEKVDVVQIFRPSEAVPPIVDQAIQIGAKVVWMQEGIVNEEAAAHARAAGLEVVMDRCMKKTHRRLVKHNHGEHG
ncbi:MAG TPA: CoA-binding protein [Anaerolineae bacterium]